MRVINDPLGQTHSSISSDHYFKATFALFCDIVKSGNGCTYGQQSCKNNDHSQTWLWVGRVDQKILLKKGRCVSTEWTLPFLRLFSTSIVDVKVQQDRSHQWSVGPANSPGPQWLSLDLKVLGRTYVRTYGHSVWK